MNYSDDNDNDNDYAYAGEDRERKPTPIRQTMSIKVVAGELVISTAKAPPKETKSAAK